MKRASFAMLALVIVIPMLSLICGAVLWYAANLHADADVASQQAPLSKTSWQVAR